MLHNDINVISTLAKRPDNYISGERQPVRVSISEFTQPRLKRPEGGRKPEAVNRKCKTGFESSKDKQTTKPVPAVEYKYAWSSGYSVNQGGALRRISSGVSKGEVLLVPRI